MKSNRYDKASQQDWVNEIQTDPNCSSAKSLIKSIAMIIGALGIFWFLMIAPTVEWIAG